MAGTAVLQQWNHPSCFPLCGVLSAVPPQPATGGKATWFGIENPIPDVTTLLIIVSRRGRRTQAGGRDRGNGIAGLGWAGAH